MVPLIIFILITSELALILAHLGFFSIWPIFLAIPLTLTLSRPAGASGHRGRRRVEGRYFLPLLPILSIAFIFFFRPYQYMDGGWDPGNYINTGAHIARTGSVVYYDDMVKDSAGLVRADGTGIKYPGLYVKDADKGLVVPQFFHLYPVWIAIFYKLFGLKSVFYVNPFFALLSVIILFLIGERLIDKGYGFLSAVLLYLNIIQIQNARFSTSEILGQFLLLSGFYFWIEYLNKDERSFAFWAGVSFGEFLLVGVTSFLIIPILTGYLVFRHNKRDIYFIIPFVCLLVHLVIQSITYSSIYLESVIMFFQRKEVYIFVLLFLLALVLCKISPLTLPSPPGHPCQSMGQRGKGEGVCKAKPCTFRMVSFVLPIFFIYGYFIRPHISNSIEALNLVELGNWLSLFGLLVAISGLMIIVYKEKDEGLLLFAITALLFAIFFIYDKRMYSRYPFALRRYIPIVIPAYCLYISYLCKRFGRFFSILIIPIVIAIPFYRCRDIITVKDHHGWLVFWADFANHVDNDALYISNNYRWARPLSDIFGKKIVTDKRLLKEGLYYISDANQPYALDRDFVEIYRKHYKGEYLEHSLTFPPKKREQEICFKIYKVEEAGPLTRREYIIDIGEEDIGLLMGFDKARSFSGIEGTARWTFTPPRCNIGAGFNEAKLAIPWFGDNVNQVLTIMAGGMSREAGESVISLYINNKSIIENYKIDEQMKEYVFHIPPGSVNTDNSKRVTLTIRSNTWSPGQYGIKGFPDNLGILLNWVKIEGI